MQSSCHLKKYYSAPEAFTPNLQANSPDSIGLSQWHPAREAAHVAISAPNPADPDHEHIENTVMDKYTRRGAFLGNGIYSQFGDGSKDFIDAR